MPARAAIVTAHTMPVFVGGTTRLTYMISSGLTDHQIDVNIFSTNQSSFHGTSDNTLDLNQKVKIHFVPFVYAFGRPITFDLFFRLVKFRPNLIHLYTPFPGAELACIAASKVLRVPMIVTWTMDALLEKAGGNRGFGNLATTLYNYLSVFLFRDADAIISLNETYSERSQYLSILRRKVLRFFFLHQGTDTDKFKPLSSDEIADFKRSRGLLGFFNILFVGRLVEYKGVDDLLAAFKILKRTHLKIKLLIVGDGYMRLKLEHMAEKLCLKDVVFQGYVPDEQLLNYYNASDLVVVPSKNNLENVPLTLLDAMACGKPVIHSDVGGARDQIQDGKVGLLVPPNDVKHLAEALEFMICNPKKSREMGLEGRKYAETVDWKALSSRLHEIYQSTLAMKSRNNAKTTDLQTNTHTRGKVI